MDELAHRLREIRKLDYQRTFHDLEHTRQVHEKEQEEHRAFRKKLEAIKEKLKRDGERSLTGEERVIVDQRRRYFFPEEG